MYYLDMPEPQSFKNHARFDPPQHFIAMPILLINFIACIVMTIRIAISPEPRMLGLHIWLTIVSFALAVLAVNSRVKDLRVQDRVIRLEERLRYAALLPQPQLAAASALTLRQIVALRFASDAELPALIGRTLAENLTPKQIKQSIVNWRADNLRV
jgi:hypothetical protein